MPSPFSGALFLLVLHSKRSGEKAARTYHLNVYSITPWHDHPAEKKKRKREEAAQASGSEGDKVTSAVIQAPQEQRITWRVSHSIRLAEGSVDTHNILTYAFDRASLSLALYCKDPLRYQAISLTLYYLLREQSHLTSVEVPITPRFARRGGCSLSCAIHDASQSIQTSEHIFNSYDMSHCFF